MNKAKGSGLMSKLKTKIINHIQSRNIKAKVMEKQHNEKH